jgi:Mor family transcriptional regulator
VTWDNIDTSSITLDMLPEDGKEIAALIGVVSYLKLVEEYGGRSIYIHKLDAVRRSVRDDTIRKEFTGENHAFLCKKFDLSEKQIRLILAADRRNQLSLFPEN